MKRLNENKYYNTNHIKINLEDNLISGIWSIENESIQSFKKINKDTLKEVPFENIWTAYEAIQKDINQKNKI